jgi:phosphoribosylamine--glycine ligase
MAITSFGKNIEQALARSYINAAQINFKGKNYRKDIGFDL